MQYKEVKTIIKDYRLAHIQVYAGNSFIQAGIKPNKQYEPAKRFVNMIENGFDTLDQQELRAFKLGFIEHASGNVAALRMNCKNTSQYYHLRHNAVVKIGQYLDNNMEFKDWYNCGSQLAT
jgi:hypothetical protein